MKECSLSLKHSKHENANRFRNREHEREEDHYLCNSQQSHRATSISVGPTVRVASVHRFAAFLPPDGSPTLKSISVGPTVRVASVHRFAAFLPPDGSPTLKTISVGPTVRVALVHRFAAFLPPDGSPTLKTPTPKNVPDEATRTSDK